MRYQFTSDYTVALGNLSRFHVGTTILFDAGTAGVLCGRLRAVAHTGTTTSLTVRGADDVELSGTFEFAANSPVEIGSVTDENGEVML
jgi:hypothetical protein